MPVHSTSGSAVRQGIMLSKRHFAFIYLVYDLKIVPLYQGLTVSKEKLCSWNCSFGGGGRTPTPGTLTLGEPGHSLEVFQVL